MRALIVWLCLSPALFAQPFSAGIRGGIPFTDFLNATENGSFDYNAPTQRYIIGPMAEVRLPFGIGIEFDALYRHISFSGSGILDGINTNVQGSGGNWEFPLMLKYRFHFPVVKPYVDAGVAWNTITGLSQTFSSAVPATAISYVQDSTTAGVVLGAGVDIHVVVVHISPEVRFTRWNAQQINDPSGLLHSNQNQAEFLVGLTF
jgi:opacity protein-like surface antigen